MPHSGVTVGAGREVFVGAVVDVLAGCVVGSFVGIFVAVRAGVIVWLGMDVFVGTGVEVFVVGVAVDKLVGVDVLVAVIEDMPVGVDVLVGVMVLVSVGEGTWGFVPVGVRGVREAVAVNEAVAVKVVVKVNVGDALENGSTVFVMVMVGEFVGVKKSWANASLVNTLSKGVEVAVYLGWRTISSRLSGLSPAAKNGRVNATIQVPRITSRTMEPCIFILLDFLLLHYFDWTGLGRIGSFVAGSCPLSLYNGFASFFN